MIGVYALMGLLLFVVLYLFVVNKSLDGDVEKHSNFASALQNLVVALSIVFTGVWTVHTFDLLNQKDKAAAELKELQERINNTESTNITLDTSEVDYSDAPGKKGLIVNVKIKNLGKSKVLFDFSKSPLKIYKIMASGAKVGSVGVLEPKLYSELAEIGSRENEPKGKNKPIDKWISLASSERVLSYFVTLDKDSLYYIVFSSKANDLDSVDKECTDDKCNWFVSKYVYIGKDKKSDESSSVKDCFVPVSVTLEKTDPTACRGSLY